MDFDQLQLEKLRDESNWKEWQFVIKTLLDNDDLLEVCEGLVSQPDSNKDPKRWNEWSKANKAAKKLIVTTVETNLLHHLISLEDASQMWKKLHSIFQPSQAKESLESVQKKFFEYKFNANDTLAQHISNLEQMASKMKILGGEIPESMVITRILSTLPYSFNYFESAWNSIEPRQKTLENLTSLLLTEDRHHQNQPFENIGVMKRQIMSKCGKCGKEGHLEKDCWCHCYECGSYQHIKRYCPLIRSVNNLLERGFYIRKSQNIEEPNVMSSLKLHKIDKCSKCRKEGHVEKYCSRGNNCMEWGSTEHIQINCPSNKKTSVVNDITNDKKTQLKQFLGQLKAKGSRKLECDKPIEKIEMLTELSNKQMEKEDEIQRKFEKDQGRFGDTSSGRIFPNYLEEVYSRVGNHEEHDKLERKELEKKIRVEVENQMRKEYEDFTKNIGIKNLDSIWRTESDKRVSNSWADCVEDEEKNKIELVAAKRRQNEEEIERKLDAERGSFNNKTITRNFGTGGGKIYTCKEIEQGEREKAEKEKLDLMAAKQRKKEEEIERRLDAERYETLIDRRRSKSFGSGWQLNCNEDEKYSWRNRENDGDKNVEVQRDSNIWKPPQLRRERKSSLKYSEGDRTTTESGDENNGKNVSFKDENKKSIAKLNEDTEINEQISKLFENWRFDLNL